MTSEVEICNLALSNIRAGSINSLNESGIQAQACKLKYGLLRDRCLKEPWLFNRRIVALALVDIEIFNWAHAYQYPTNCLKIRRLMGAHEEIAAGQTGVISRAIDAQSLPVKNIRAQIPYEVFNFTDNKVIGTNDEHLRIDYAAKVTDPNLFSEDFILALSYLLAAEVAVPIVGAKMGRELRSDSLTLYKQYLAAATAGDLNDQYLEPPESDFVTVRR